MQIYATTQRCSMVFISNSLTLLLFSMHLLEKISHLRLLVFDLDGVLTNGKLLILPNGEWVREMDIKDGFALQYAVKAGLIIAVITGSSSIPVKQRLSRLGIELFFENAVSKSIIINDLLSKYGIDKSAAMFMGDDIPDLDAFTAVSVKCCPADAASDVLEMADYISPKNGGNGCVRDVIEKILRAQGKWVMGSTIQSI